MNRNACLAGTATALIGRPFTWMSARSGADDMSKFQKRSRVSRTERRSGGHPALPSLTLRIFNRIARRLKQMIVLRAHARLLRRTADTYDHERRRDESNADQGETPRDVSDASRPGEHRSDQGAARRPDHGRLRVATG